MNAANEGQVKELDRKEKLLSEVRMAALKNVLKTKPGQDVLWWFMEESEPYGSVFSKDPMIMARNSGRQDFGHFLKAQIMAADKEAFFTMMRDNDKLKGETNA